MRARRVGSRPILLGACIVCPMLRLELEEKNITIRSLEKDVAPRPPTVDCLIFPGLIGDMDDLTVEKTNLENENTNLRAILGWVSCHEPQLGMVIKQYQREMALIECFRIVGLWTYYLKDFNALL